MIVYNNFEWDVREAAACLTTHGVSFKEASTVFADGDVAISEDPASGHLRAVGTSARGRKLVVLHQNGARVRILSATLPTSRPAARKADAAPASAPAPSAPVPSVPAPSAPVIADMAAEPAAQEAAVEPPTSSGRIPGAGWSAEVYGVYWDAYSATRNAARQQGKSTREAQRLGREAGERAVSALGETAAK